MRERMREGKNPAPIVGGSSLLVIFAVLCLTVFAMLSLTQAQADRRLAQNSWSAVTGYYQADCQAQEILSQLRAGERPDGVTAEGEGVFSYACPISDAQTLEVRVRLTGESHRDPRLAGCFHGGLAGGRGPGPLGREHMTLFLTRRRSPWRS